MPIIKSAKKLLARLKNVPSTINKSNVILRPL